MIVFIKNLFLIKRLKRFSSDLGIIGFDHLVSVSRICVVMRSRDMTLKVPLTCLVESQGLEIISFASF